MKRRTHMPMRIGCLLVCTLWCLTAVTADEPPANRVLTLDGKSDFMLVSDSPSLRAFTDAITMELWFQAASFYPETGQVNCLLRKNIQPGEEDFFLRFRTIEGEPWLEVSVGVEVGMLRTYHAFKPGRWYHLAGTYDGSTLTAFVNGVQIESTHASGRMDIAKQDLLIGMGDPEFSHGEYFHGLIDEIRLWNVPRTKQEIQAAMDGPLTGKEEGLVAYWNFDDGTTRDLSGQGNDGIPARITESPRPSSDMFKKQEPVETAEAPAVELPEGARERARDRIIHIEDGVIREIPDVPRLCDQIDLRKEKVSIGDCELYCEHEGNGTALVLLHGGPGATHHDFHPHFSRAAEFAHVIYYDQRGCGLSDYDPGKGYSVDQATDDLDRLREALGIGQWVVLGHSYGGLLAQCYAKKYPENLKGLVLTCAVTGLHGSSMPSRQRDFISARERQKMSQIRNTSGLSTAQLIYNNFLNGDWKRQLYYKPTREQIARIARYGWVHDNNFNGIMSSSTKQVDLAGAFAQCPVPTLIFEAKWDMTWNTDKPEQIRKNHPNARFVMLEESGHSAFVDESEKYFGALKDFMNDLPQIPAARVQTWKRDVAQRQQTPEQFVRSRGWGRKSNEQIAAQYDTAWLTRIDDFGIWLKIGFALYDVKRYEDALAVFETMQNEAGDENALAMALIWQGHMLDLLGKRQEAIARYQKAAELDLTGGVRHDQFGLAYEFTPYARERIETPFSRVENRDEN